MKVMLNKICFNNLQPAFKAQYKNIGDFENFSEDEEPEAEVSGFDDEVSQSRRQLIRNSITAKAFYCYEYHKDARKNSDKKHAIAEID